LSYITTSLNSVKYVKRYPLDSLQIYFASSLELQQEFLSHGFYVPKDHDKKVVMPIPIIYANFKGWVASRQPITIERVIPLEWIGLIPEQLGWKEREIWIRGKKRRAFDLPEEEMYVDIGITSNVVVFNFDVKRYHLERTSIRQVNPEKWSNWTMFYISMEYLSDIVDTLCRNTIGMTSTTINVVKEVQQGGKEVTYYTPVKVVDFSLCLGCFDLVLLYLKKKAEEHCYYYPLMHYCSNIENEVKSLKLRLIYDQNINTFAKVGIAKMMGKRPQMMVKLASEGPIIKIKGVLKDVVEGKARGKLVYCNHTVKRLYVALDLTDFCKALTLTRNYINLLPSE